MRRTHDFRLLANAHSRPSSSACLSSEISSVSLTESMTMPRNSIRWSGPSTFFRDRARPNSTKIAAALYAHAQARHGDVPTTR